MSEVKSNEYLDQTAETEASAWVKPAIVSFQPAKAAEGISYRPLDGLANLT